MFKKKRKYNRKKNKDILEDNLDESIGLDSDIKRGIIIVFIITFGAISFLSLFNIAGALGGFLSKGLTASLGWGRWLFPFLMFFLGYFLYNEGKYFVKKMTYFGIFLLFISIQAILHLFTPVEEWKEAISYGAGGGYFGYFIALCFYKIMGIIATWLALVAIFITSLMLTFNASLKKIIGGESPLNFLFSPFKLAYTKLFNNKIDDEYYDENEEENNEESLNTLKHNEEELSKYDNDSLDEKFSKKTIGESNTNKNNEAQEKTKTEKTPDISLNSAKVKIDLPINLLKAAAGKPTSGDIKSNIDIITKTLENFGINIEMGDVTVGPTVTQYAFKPADGVKLSRITALRSDLSLALAAHPLRIEAPIPGKALVGLEMPNQKKALVSLKEILTDVSFKKNDNALALGLGKDVAGKVWVDNLAKMPHVIVAGATNSGKSVCLNTIIVSLLYRNNPDELRFIMVDPKRVELTVYNDIPHLLTPVITDVNKTVNALKWCLNEMDRRFDVLSKKGKRNIQSYNETLKPSDEKMPYIIFVIDELADLMVSAKRDVEAAIIRLAQMARAVGIHLILATQRPSTDVITGLIKANTPARIAFAVASGIDSRTILDSTGAEDLLGQGDLLMSTPAIAQPKRLQGAYLSDIEIKRIVRYIKEQVDGETFYINDIVENQQVKGVASMGIDPGGTADSEGGDQLFNEAKELVINSGKASASLLQRRLSVGYARAARIMDLLEEAGIIGGANGSKPREILISKEQLEESLNTPTSFTPIHNPDEFEPKDNYLTEAPDHLNEEVPENPVILKKENSYTTPENSNKDNFSEYEEEDVEKKSQNKKELSTDDVYEGDSEDNKKEKNNDLEDEGKFFSK